MTQEPKSQSEKESQGTKPKSLSPERRFVQRQIVQPLIQWMPLGGSAGLFVSFLLKQEWLQVFITFPITVVTGVWAAYSKNFVERLSEIYGERGKRDADSLMGWMDDLNQALAWQLSGFEAKYLKCQKLACQEDETEGVKHEDGIFTPLLQEVFVPLRLSTDSVLPGYLMRSHNSDDIEQCRVVPIWDLLREVRKESVFRQIAIRAWGGYGKTTLLKHVTYTYATQTQGKYRAPKLIPFLLRLTRCWQQLASEKTLSLPELLTQYHFSTLPQGKELKTPPNWAVNLLNRGEALVMFDGFDEVPLAERKGVSRWLSQQMNEYRESVFIVTSRPTAFTQYYTAKHPTASYWIEDFNPEQRRRFVEQWYFCHERLARAGRNTEDVKFKATQNAESLLAQIAARPELTAMAGNALMLNMMARFHRDKQGAQLPQRRVELYQEICELQLGRRPKAREIPLLLNSYGQRQEVLQGLALAMLQRASQDQQGEEQGFKQIQQDDLLALLAMGLHKHDPDVIPEDFLSQIVDVSELLVQRDHQEDRVYEFAHLSFQEFLAASEVVRLKQEELLYEWLGVDAWKPTILFYANLVNPTRLIRKAIERQQSAIAYLIYREAIKHLDLSPQVQKDLKGVKPELNILRYAELEAALKAGEWEAADQETYRLMITTAGKDEGQYFDLEELLNFPCEELLAIDGLWVKYSDGKFGFSVQKKIYLDCGGIADGKYHEEAWEKFCHKVGWQVNAEYYFVKYNTSSPPGHLPVRWEGDYSRWSDVDDDLELAVTMRMRTEMVRYEIFSRIETCKL